jgi:hypothetical protein
MPNITTFKDVLSGSNTQLNSITSSLLGTASYSLYAPTASHALNAAGIWSSSSLSIPTSDSQSVAGFNISGSTTAYSTNQDPVYLVVRNGLITWESLF